MLQTLIFANISKFLWGIMGKGHPPPPQCFEWFCMLSISPFTAATHNKQNMNGNDFYSQIIAGCHCQSSHNSNCQHVCDLIKNIPVLLATPFCTLLFSSAEAKIATTTPPEFVTTGGLTRH